MDRLIDDLPDEIRRDSAAIDRSKRTAAVVYRLVDGEAVATAVRAGPSDLTHTLVIEGLSEGDPVVIGPYKVLEELEDGEQIYDEEEVTEETEVVNQSSPEPEAGEDTPAPPAELQDSQSS